MKYWLHFAQAVIVLATVSMLPLFYWTLRERWWLSAGMSVLAFISLLPACRRMVPVVAERAHPTFNYVLFWTVITLTIVFLLHQSSL